jgi:hypothetical protein
MKLKVLIESVEFYPSFTNDEGYIVAPMETKDGQCPLCDGSGEDFNDNTLPCMQCEGKGEVTRQEYTVPHINVGNKNSITIMQMLGVPENEQEPVGTIPNSQLPEVKRRLLMLKNSGKARDKHTRDTQEYQGKKETYVDKSGDVPQIKSRGGAHVVEFGLRPDQIERYIDVLLDIVQTAQDRGYDISWG